MTFGFRTAPIVLALLVAAPLGVAEDLIVAPGELCPTLCVTLILDAKISDLFVPFASVAPLATVTAEFGSLHVEANGIPADIVLFLARVNGLPDPGTLNQDVGPVSTSYSLQAPLCLLGSCSFSLGAAPTQVKAGELWLAHAHITSGDLQVGNIPFFQVVTEA